MAHKPGACKWVYTVLYTCNYSSA